MKTNNKICEFCGLEYIKNGSKKCTECTSIYNIKNFIQQYSLKHRDAIFKNKSYQKHWIKDKHEYKNNVQSFTLEKYETKYRVEKRTKRVQAVIDKITYIRDYLYFELNPIFEILDSIYIKKDSFWDDTGNLVLYVHNCCFKEAILMLSELLNNSNCKYSIKKICNTLLADSKYVFNDQIIYEQFVFEQTKDVVEERFYPFDIKKFASLIEKSLEGKKAIIDSFKDFRDNRFAHIDELKNKNSARHLTYVNLKRMFSLVKVIYDAFLYVVAPDKYASIMVDSNIWFDHLNQMSKVYKDFLGNEEERLCEKTSCVIKEKDNE